MKRTQEEFWNSSFAQVITMIDMYSDEMKMKAAVYNNEEYESKYFNEEPQVVNSLNEIGGLV